MDVQWRLTPHLLSGPILTLPITINQLGQGLVAQSKEYVTRARVRSAANGSKLMIMRICIRMFQKVQTTPITSLGALADGSRFNASDKFENPERDFRRESIDRYYGQGSIQGQPRGLGRVQFILIGVDQL